MMINIAIDPSRRLIEIGVVGFLTVKQVEDHALVLPAMLIANGIGVRGFYRIIDTSKAAIQSQEVLAALVELDLKYEPEREAYVTGTTASRIQARRSTAHVTNFEKKMFVTRKEAVEWLFEDHARQRTRQFEYSIQQAA